MEDETEYPSVRKALLGNGHVANIRCAVKYVVWQTGYVLLAILGVLFIGVTSMAEFVGQSRMADWLSRTKDRLMENQSVKKASRVGGKGILIVALVVGIANTVYLAVTIPLMFAFALGFVVLLIGAIYAIGTVVEKYEDRARQRRLSDDDQEPGRVRTAASKLTSKAKKTPGVRRVYGKCPVSMDIEPKWFQKISKK